MLKVSECKEIQFYANFVYEGELCGWNQLQKYPFREVNDMFDNGICTVEFRNQQEYRAFIKLQELANNALGRYFLKALVDDFGTDEIPF